MSLADQHYYRSSGTPKPRVFATGSVRCECSRRLSETPARSQCLRIPHRSERPRVDESGPENPNQESDPSAKAG